MVNKNVLVIAGNSGIVLHGLKLLLNAGYSVFLTTRKDFDFEHKNLKKFKLDVVNESSFLELSKLLCDVEFHAIVNCAGIVVASPVEYLSDSELQKQLDVNLFGLLRIIRHFSSKLSADGRLINISSMASWGLFPFISPYCLSKAASDVLLRAFSNETGIKCVSIRPGSYRTAFWNSSIKNNEDNFKNFTPKYEKIGKFILNNAKNNALRAPLPIPVGRAIFKAIEAKNPADVINVGFDSKFVAFISSFLPVGIVNCAIKHTIKRRALSQ